MWSDAYDLPLLESVKIFEFDLRFPWGTRPRSLVSLVAEFDRDFGSLHQYTQVIILEILRCGAMHMTSHCWDLSKFLSLNGHLVAKFSPYSSRVRSGHWQPTPVYPSDCFKNIEMWSNAYDFPLLESVKISEFDLRFPRGTWSRSSVPTVAEFDLDIGSLHTTIPK